MFVFIDPSFYFSCLDMRILIGLTNTKNLKEFYVLFNILYALINKFYLPLTESTNYR